MAAAEQEGDLEPPGKRPRTEQPAGQLNEGRLYQGRVRGAGGRLAAYLSAQFSHHSEAEWRRLVQQGAVSVDSQLEPDPERLVAPGQLVGYHRPPWVEPPVPGPDRLAVLFEDEHLVLFHKPSGLPVLRSEMFYQHTVVGYLERRYPPTAQPTPAHRLGVGTSGVLMCAKTKPARSGLSRALERRQISKSYLALVSIPSGAPALPASFVVTEPIGQVRYRGGLSIAAVCPDGKPSRSEATVLHRGAQAAVLRVKIPTGRPHQIRIHMAAQGFPLLGDPLYGPGGLPRDDIPLEEQPGEPRQTPLPRDCGYHLHAHRVELEHPISGEPMVVEAPVPAALTADSEELRCAG